MKFLIFLIALTSSLFSSSLPELTSSHSAQQIEWLEKVDQALDDPDYCSLLDKLVLSPYADPDVNLVLIDILIFKCN